MAFKLPTRNEIQNKINEYGVETLSSLEEFVYDEEPDFGRQKKYWRERLEKVLAEVVEEAQSEAVARNTLEKFQGKY